MNRSISLARKGIPILTILSAAALVTTGVFGFSSAYAKPIRVAFSGTVTSLSEGYNIPGINIGDAVSGVLTFDPTITDSQAHSQIGLYQGAITSLNVTIGAKTFVPSLLRTNEIDVIDDDSSYGTYYDMLLFRSWVMEPSNPGVYWFFQLTFSQSAASPPLMLTSDALPTSLDLDAFGRSGFVTYISPSASQGSNFTLTSATMAPVPEPSIKLLDFDGDGKTDIAVYRASNGGWYIIPSSTGVPYGVGWGGDPTDKPVPADYDGDGKTDIAVYRASNGGWYIIPSSTGVPYGVGWGGDPTDKPVPADYDGDGKTDIAVYRASNGGWYIIPSSTPSTPYGVGWGGDPSDIPVPGDYDGDGKTDVAIYRPSVDGWFIIPSSTPSAPIMKLWVFWEEGWRSDIPVPADYDADGKTDIAIYRRHTYWVSWHVVPSSGWLGYLLFWGYVVPDDKPVPGDYDGDGRTDCAVYRASNGGWYITPSSSINSGTTITYLVEWGGDPSDVPLTYLPAID